MSLVVRFVAPALVDIIDILQWSEAKFGAAARGRYEALIGLAAQQIAADPTAVPAHERPEISPGLWSLHLRSVAGGEVDDPPHLVFYRFDVTHLRVVRVLHEARDLTTELRA